MPSARKPALASVRRLCQCIVLLAASCGPCHSAPAPQIVPSEQMVRAAMVFNFLRFTDFPPGSVARGGVIRLCVDVSDKRQEMALSELSGRRIGGHTLVVREGTAGGRPCQVLYVDSHASWNASAKLGALTIGSYAGFARDGGMIEIAVGGDGTSFDINRAESGNAGFHFSPQLLNLATNVYE